MIAVETWLQLSRVVTRPLSWRFATLVWVRLFNEHTSFPHTLTSPLWQDCNARVVDGGFLQPTSYIPVYNRTSSHIQATSPGFLAFFQDDFTPANQAGLAGTEAPRPWTPGLRFGASIERRIIILQRRYRTGDCKRSKWRHWCDAGWTGPVLLDPVCTGVGQGRGHSATDKARVFFGPRKPFLPDPFYGDCLWMADLLCSTSNDNTVFVTDGAMVVDWDLWLWHCNSRTESLTTKSFWTIHRGYTITHHHGYKSHNEQIPSCLLYYTQLAKSVLWTLFNQYEVIK